MKNSAQLEIVRRLFEEVWSKGNLDVVHETDAENFVRHGFDIEGGRVSRDGATDRAGPTGCEAVRCHR